MIKFFRKIRQKLLSENKFSKYFLYAIGEIILVVIGILIAIQIDNWNQDRIDSNIEQRLLKAISGKIKFNESQHEMGHARYISIIEAAESLLITANDTTKKLAQKEVKEHLSMLTKRFLMGKSNETSIYDELIGSGQLILLKSEKLRAELTALKGNMQLLAAYEDEHLNFIDNHLSPYLNDRVDRLLINQYAKNDAYDDLLAVNLNHIPINASFEDQIIKERKFSNLLVELITHSKTLLPIYNRINMNLIIIDSITSEQGPF
jgi:hypothetical protein